MIAEAVARAYKSNRHQWVIIMTTKPTEFGSRTLLRASLLMIVAVLIFGVSIFTTRTDVSAKPRPLPLATPLPTTPDDFRMPGTQPHGLFAPIPDPDTCSVCHTAPIYDTWRGSMMGQAGRDPLFWAALAVAEEDAPGSGEFCLRCHAPKGWFEGRSHPSDGSGLTAADLNAGVACEVCHRMVDPVPSSDDEAVAIDLEIRENLSSTVPADRLGSGMMIVDPVDNRRGPFSLDPPHSALRTDFLGQDADPVTESRLCGTCHNIDNPALGVDREPT